MKKSIYLFLALLLPILILLFLKFFGKNEFAVNPLYVNELPVVPADCPAVTKLPYLVPDSVMNDIASADSLTVVFFGKMENEEANQFSRAKEEIASDPVLIIAYPESERTAFRRRCIFFLDDKTCVVLVDSDGSIRGIYAANRKEIDRLLTEITIILKKY
ncbi:MAG: hypothetical protein ABJA70_22505 [Chryseolinea sp.]